VFHTPSVRLGNQVVEHWKNDWTSKLDARETWSSGDGPIHHPGWESVSSTGVSLAPSVCRELALADAHRRTFPTEVNTTSVAQRRPPETVLGNPEMHNADLPPCLPRFPSLEIRVAVPSAVRARDYRSFENLPTTAVARTPQGVLGVPSSSQSFFEGMARLRPSGMSRGEFRRRDASGVERARVEMLGSMGEGEDGRESIPDVVVYEDWDGDSRMTDAG
jgi:hypothetical protein